LIVLQLLKMNYKLILLVIVSLFIGANLMCSCCRYPIFTYLSGASIKEGIDNKDVGQPGSAASKKKAAEDAAEMIANGQPMPDIIKATGSVSDKKEPMAGLASNFMTGLDQIVGMVGGSGGSGGAEPRPEKISVTTAGKEGLALMGSDINEVQNGDVAGMWVTKANTYASEFGYGIINNTGSAYTADEPLKNGELVLFAKNKFKPECCPAPYSSSTGCVCMTPEQINYLNTRGGNRTSDSGV
jgi:hypothetical protein